ncbi:MAG TPA: OmpA family protein [Flavobacterium sp.]|nr:OmpA family protein [Flavobacterium sp.]
MKQGVQILLFLSFGFLSAQEKTVQSVYFDFDKFYLDKSQINTIIEVVNSPSFSQCETIQIYGYCDDRGSKEYNDKLSVKRVATVQEILLSNGVAQNRIFICEGRGSVLLDKDSIKNIQKTRDGNRRVDLVLIKKNAYTFFPANPKLGDVILLERISFEMGSSILSLKAKKELDRAVLILEKHKSLQFEIKGHVCCTSNKYSDAIDKASLERNLSTNRAKTVFLYLRSKGISPYRMSYKGYGNRFPLGKSDALDRRVEFLITKL